MSSPQVQEMLNFLRINSSTENGNEELVNYLIPIFERAGAKIILQPVPMRTMISASANTI